MKEKASPSIFGEIFSVIWDVITEIVGAFFAVLPKAISFMCWVLAGIVVIPCVFVAAHLFPLWTEWGEDL